MNTKDTNSGFGIYTANSAKNAVGLHFFVQILSWLPRQQVDHRSFGDLFRICNNELENLRFIDALQRIIQMARAMVQKSATMSKKVVQAIMDAVMGAAIIFFGFSSDKSNLISKH